MSATESIDNNSGTYVNSDGVTCELTLTGTGPDDDGLDAIARALGLTLAPARSDVAD